MQSQKPACKDLGHNGQRPTIAPEAAYTSVSKRDSSRSV
ncbi:transcriptional regulator [Lacticaseibacillus paracasei]|nr:transcriptional regulator [Lacticaseibacillus paracasei]MBB1167944.1 transcriptional regulator [Lacticaseibacillus paracasei]MCT3343924.1 transcriptional regulator [Lacticaseibacillus paracasei]MCT3369519.1 transcriptional regulator [Lacticaseibacillus paracasei]MCT4386353.1 transcriptional regulator [Lacticaseibacillus paracasei]